VKLRPEIFRAVAGDALMRNPHLYKRHQGCARTLYLDYELAFFFKFAPLPLFDQVVAPLSYFDGKTIFSCSSK
jgi:hypothetical protein